MLHQAPAPAPTVFCGEINGREYTPIIVGEGGFASTGGDLKVSPAARISGERQAKTNHPECTRSAQFQLQMVDLV